MIRRAIIQLGISVLMLHSGHELLLLRSKFTWHRLHFEVVLKVHMVVRIRITMMLIDVVRPTHIMPEDA